MNHRHLPLVLALAAGTSLALAHAGTDGAAHHGFAEGMLHPFTGLDHLAAMLAVGVWSAGTPNRRWLAPLGFMALLALGALLGQGLPAVEPMIAASLLVMGALLMAPRRPLLAALPMAGFALFHGAAHGQELSGTAALLGMLAGSALLHGAGIALGLALQRASQWLPRAGGLGIALLGLGLLVA
ncbi:HupE/UreJ family protein [Pelomonas sp. V22]|uniref:HupE/UreJ family protein n=1 Tax=Pelomonas sp. V22 TaxID=2822139 RepID=UPI0024A85C3A|nr:HupE/UreJ family protein [Pelomonas sp. V22]MDI4635383.1 HupE/UreJ family protein [Pelomonas sp. V22]